MATDDSSFMTTVNTPNTSAVVNMLTCCTGYSFTVTARTSVGLGQRTLPVTFRTHAESIRKSTNNLLLPSYICAYMELLISADLVCSFPSTETVSVNARSLNATNILVTWTIPTSVSSQGVTSFTVSVSPQCMNGISRGGTQNIDVSDENVNMVNVGNLGESGVLYLLLHSQEISCFYCSIFHRAICPLPSFRCCVHLSDCSSSVQQHSLHPGR